MKSSKYNISYKGKTIHLKLSINSYLNHLENPVAKEKDITDKFKSYIMKIYFKKTVLK